MQKNDNNELSGFAGYLTTHYLLSKEKIAHAIYEATQTNSTFIDYLSKNNYLDDCQLAEATAHYFGLSFFDLNSYDVANALKEVLDIDFVQKHYVLPLFKNEKYLYVAVSDPTLSHLKEINFITGFNTVFVIVEINKLTKMIDDFSSKRLRGMLEDPDDNTVDFINTILQDAINKGASDIHFEPYEMFYRIRFRIDGILYEIAKQALTLFRHITARLKVMSNLDIAEHRIPQDGRFKIYFPPKKAIDFRISTCPTSFGEKTALRILESSQELLALDSLGINELQKEIFLQAISYAQGLILVTGPTGSGKTVTLYTALSQLNTSEVNISSVEDPIEIYMPGINQVQVNIKTGLTFAMALRAFLRQDPDILMIGEMRDLETAEIAVKAAQTGHLVFSTLHTNSAPETLIRLSNMGVEPFNIANSIRLILAQRLVRRLCDHCKKYDDHNEIPKYRIYIPVGCEYCTAGYKGRVGIFEVMPISHDIKKIIIEKGNVLQLAEQAQKEGFMTLRQSGLNHVKNGVTSLEEINRVIRE